MTVRAACTRRPQWLAPVDLANAFNAAWAEMIARMQNDGEFRHRAVQEAQQADAQTWQQLCAAG